MEAGYRGIQGVIRYGVSGPAGIPQDIVSRVNSELNKLLALPEVIERYAGQGGVPAPGTPQQYTAFVESELAKWRPVVKSSGAKVD